MKWNHEETARRVRDSDPALTELDLRGESTAIFVCSESGSDGSKIKMLMQTIDAGRQKKRRLERGADRRTGQEQG